MKEKSQLEDMRAAVRGDIERARARREADPWRAQETEPEPQTVVLAEEADDMNEIPSEEQPATEPAEQEATPVPEPEPVAAAADEVPEPATLPDEAPQPEPVKKGFFARLFGR